MLRDGGFSSNGNSSSSSNFSGDNGYGGNGNGNSSTSPRFGDHSASGPGVNNGGFSSYTSSSHGVGGMGSSYGPNGPTNIGGRHEAAIPSPFADIMADHQRPFSASGSFNDRRTKGLYKYSDFSHSKFK